MPIGRAGAPNSAHALCRGANGRDVLRVRIPAGALEHGRARNQHIGAGSNDQRRRLGRNAAVDLDIDGAIADDGPQAGLFGATVATAYGFPPVMGAWVTALVGRPDWRCYVAYDGDRPVGAGALHLGQTHGWLGFAATRTYARNRGAHSGLIAMRVAAAAAAGKAWVVGEATTTPDARNPGHDNGLRGGFQVVHRRAAYVI